MLHTGAFNWTYTLGAGSCDPFANGTTSVVYTGGHDPRIWTRLIADFGVTIMASVPGIYRQILRIGFSPSPSLRHGLSAGEALLAFVRDRLAAYKCPKQIWFVPALPRTANGKLIRKALERP